MNLPQQNPAQQYSALRALAHGLNEALVAAAHNVVAYRKLTQAKAFVDPWGDITFVRGERSINLPPAALLEWARKNMPHEVVEEHTEVVPATVRTTLITTLKGTARKAGRFRILRDTVIDTETGEEVEWATVDPAPEDTVRFSMPAEVKAEATQLVTERLAAIASTVLREVEQ